MDVADHRARAFDLALAGQRAQRLFERRDLRKRCELAGEEREVLPAQAGLAQGEQRAAPRRTGARGLDGKDVELACDQVDRKVVVSGKSVSVRLNIGVSRNIA